MCATSTGERQRFTERWETRRYDLSKLRTLDLFMSYWGVPADGPCHDELRLRRRTTIWPGRSRCGGCRTGGFSPARRSVQDRSARDHRSRRARCRAACAPMFAARTSSSTASTAPPDAGAHAASRICRRRQCLAETPQFYNSITTNCTTTDRQDDARRRRRRCRSTGASSSTAICRITPMRAARSTRARR